LEEGGVIQSCKCKVFESFADAVHALRGSWDHCAGTAKGFAIPQSLELALTLQVGKAESHFPGWPHARCGREALSIVNLTWEVLGCQDNRQCHHDKFNAGNRHGIPANLYFFLASSIPS
jgi:hypothetical protein